LSDRQSGRWQDEQIFLSGSYGEQVIQVHVPGGAEDGADDTGVGRKSEMLIE
jgi:hypothetical protein